MKTQQQIISLIETTFPVCVGNVELDDDGQISWSVEVSESEIEKLYDELHSLEPFLNQNGYDLMMQDDPEYFGAQISK